MKKESPTFIQLHPESRKSESLIKFLFDDDLPPHVPTFEAEPICCHCHKRLRRQTYICVNRVTYCVGCFAVALPQCDYYRVIGNDNFELIGDGWSARSELLLVSAIEKYLNGGIID
jgi:hypothetical protein